MALPCEFSFAMGAAILNDAGRQPTLERLIKCLQTS